VKAQDDQLWAQQVSDLRSDGEPGERFLQFFLLWFEGAATMFEETIPGQLGGFRKYAVKECVYAGLDVAEKELGFLTLDLLGQLLCVAIMHWQHGKELADELTPFEQRIVEEALARKISALQDGAMLSTEGNPLK
jgi:hypothetical protein